MMSSCVQAEYDLAPGEKNIQEMKSQPSHHIHELQLNMAHLGTGSGTRQREAQSGVKGNVTQLNG